MSVDMAAHLHALRTTGFRKLRPGRIHLRCWTCGRKQSNTPRGPHDPKRAALIEMCCERCCQGHKDCGASFFFKNGKELSASEVERAWET